MWIMLNDAMFSIVADKTDDTKLVVRSRIEGSVESVFGVDEICTTNADYRYRAYIDKEEVANTISDKVFGIDYPNFKDSVKNQNLKNAYTSIWSILYRMQTLLYGEQKWWLNYRQ